MTTAMTTIENKTLEVAGEYLEQFGNKLSKAHRNQFLNICQHFGLNPFIREIYGVPYGDKFSIIIGYEVYLKRAEMCGQLAGWKAWTEGEGKQLKGCVEIHRKDWAKPFYHEVFLSEYDQNNSMWKSKPITMIKKVCIAQSFRLAFPVELGGLPYTADELPPEMAAEQLKPAKHVHKQETISKEDAHKICEALKVAKIEAAELFKYFNICRLGELGTNELDTVYNWISANAVLPDVVDAEPEPEQGEKSLQDTYKLIATLAELAGQTPDDALAAATGGKITNQADLMDKPEPYLRDLKLALMAKIAEAKAER